MQLAEADLYLLVNPLTPTLSDRMPRGGATCVVGHGVLDDGRTMHLACTNLSTGTGIPMAQSAGEDKSGYNQ